MAFKTWFYAGMQGGLKTRLQQYPAGEIALIQQKDGGDHFTMQHRADFDLVTFNEEKLYKILKKRRKERKCAAK